MEILTIKINNEGLIRGTSCAEDENRFVSVGPTWQRFIIALRQISLRTRAYFSLFGLADTIIFAISCYIAVTYSCSVRELAGLINGEYFAIIP